MAQVEVSGLFFRLILQIMYKMKALARNVFDNALLYIQSYNYLTDAEIGLSRNSHPLVSLAFSQIVLRHGLGSATRQHRSISVGISPAKYSCHVCTSRSAGKHNRHHMVPNRPTTQDDTS